MSRTSSTPMRRLPMWELYGNAEDSGEHATEIYYLLEAATPRT
jgi:hypothetical protein